MKVKIEILEGMPEEEVVIRCPGLSDSVIALQNYISKQGSAKRCLSLKNGETEFYVPMEEIYFFETEGRELRAHTADRIFFCGYKLYELEEMLPGSFLRVSKSAILNTRQIRAIHKNIAGASEVEFAGTNKRAFVSRSYYKLLADKMAEKRLKK